MSTPNRDPHHQALLANQNNYARAPLAVLFVDPDRHHTEQLADSLRDQAMVAMVPTARAALQAIAQRLPDLIVTEFELPDTRGISFLTAIHSAQATHNVLLMVVTTHSAISDKISAFQAGADDYLVKPVEPAVFLTHLRLVSRFRRVLQR